MRGSSLRLGFFKPALLAVATIAAQSAVQAQVIDFSSSRGTGVSQSDVLVENVRLMVPVENPFQPGTTTTVETGYNVVFRFDPATLHLVPVGLAQTGGGGTQQCASATVSVFDAIHGAAAPIANASVTLGNQTVQTDAQGQATFTQLPPSLYSISAVAGDYVPATQAAVLSCDAPGNVALALSPSGSTAGGLGAGQFRVILTWGEHPTDLDSHMTGPAAAPADPRWHVYYANKNDGDMCGLDVDDVYSYGPETITCPSTGAAGALRPGVYRYSVHHYSGSNAIGTSGASVRLEFAGGQQYRFTPPAAAYAGRQDVWTVFELTVNNDGSMSVAPVNSVTGSVSSSSVRSGAGHQSMLHAPEFGKPESAQLMQGPLK